MKVAEPGSSTVARGTGAVGSEMSTILICEGSPRKARSSDTATDLVGPQETSLIRTGQSSAATGRTTDTMKQSVPTLQTVVFTADPLDHPRSVENSSRIRECVTPASYGKNAKKTTDLGHPMGNAARIGLCPPPPLHRRFPVGILIVDRSVDTWRKTVATSRRTFVAQSLAAAGAVALSPLRCSWNDLQPKRDEGGFEPAYLALEHNGQLQQREEQLWAFFERCHLCPRECGANRLQGETGFCSATARLKVAGAIPHHGEERPLVGRGGSGTIFFSNCNLLCCFCQNWQINHRGDGSYLDHRDLAETMLELQDRGCHNINLVTPTHVLPNIVKGLRIAIGMGLRLPLVYNTGGYDTLRAVQLLDGIVDIYLPDFKYQDGELAATYSSGAADYPQVAAAAIKEMHRQVGLLRVNERGIAERGLIIRHLVMPNNIAGTDRFVRWVAEELGPDTYVNIMAQYRPMHRAHEYPKIARRLDSTEWQQAMQWAKEAGLTNLDPG
jgi:putative pyruvate formate lyase activating enzyme